MTGTGGGRPRRGGRRLRATLLLAVSVVGLSIVSVTPAVSAAPSPPPTQPERSHADFNGDGFADLVVTGSDDSGTSSRTPIQILYGADSGLPKQPRAFLLEDLVSPGDNDRGLWGGFGLGATTSGDFNGDGFSDLAIGIPGLNVGDVQEAGGVLIIPGANAGLDPSRRTLITQASPGVADTPEEEDGFGVSLTAANLGRGREDDLVVGVPAEDIVGGIYDGGQVHILYGTSQGLDLRSGQVWRQNSPGIDGRAGDSDNWGSKLVTGHFAGSPFADLAVGNPGDHYHETWEHGAGTVQILYGSTAGLTAHASQRWSAASPALRHLGAVYGFPEAMAAADFDADGHDDLVLSSREGPGSAEAGSFTVLYGSRTGLNASRAQTWSQNSRGIASAPAESEAFGQALATGNFGRDGGGRLYADLAVGVAESTDRPEAGGVHIIFGGPRGLTGSHSELWSERTPGIPGVPEAGDNFGSPLAVGDFGHNPRSGTVDDLAIVVGNDILSGTELTGALVVLYGRSDGLTAQNAQRWNSVDLGLPKNGFGWFPTDVHSS